MSNNYYIRIIKHFFELKATNKSLMALLIFSSLLRVAACLIIPFVSSKIVGQLELEDYSGALWWLVALAFSEVLHIFCLHFNYHMYYRTANYIHNTLQRRILEKVVEFDPGFTANISKAALISTAFRDIDSARRIPDYLFDLAAHFVGIVASVVILCFVDWQIGLVALVLLLITVASFIFHTKKRDGYLFTQREHADEISGLYSQMIDGYKEVQTLNLKEDLSEYLEKEKDAWKKYHKKQRFHRDLAVSAVPSILGLGRIAIYLFAAALILNGEYSISLLVLVLGYYEDIVDRYNRIADSIDQVSRCSVAIERLHKLLSYKTPHMLEFGDNSTDDIRGVVEFKNVAFEYEEPPKKAPDGSDLKVPLKKAPSFKNISFRVEPNTLTAIVGKSGSGKSTIFRLLLRLYKITKGEILLDGESIYDYTKEVYATNVSIVTQKPFVFDMTIRENLSLVDSDRERQIEACKLAGIHNDIMKLEKGYDTPLVQDGENLSAGQKQLLSLARTLLSKSEVLLFDEVTSALDATTSAKIVAVLQKLKKDHTVLMITHKPELMQLADEVLVIDKGRLVASGSPRSLRQNPYFAPLQK